MVVTFWTVAIAILCRVVTDNTSDTVYNSVANTNLVNR